MLQAQLQFQFVVPFHFLFVVVVGLHGHASQHGVVALATFIPIARYVVLQELQVVIARESPEVGLFYIDVQRLDYRLNGFWGHLFHDFLVYVFYLWLWL